MKSIVAFLFVLLLASCQVKVFPPSPMAQFKNCRDQLSKAETFNRIVGRWRLVGTGCGYCVQTGSDKPTENVTLVINSNQTVEIFKDNKPFRSTTFNLESSYNTGYFRIQHPDKIYIGYIYGVIETCPGKLVFNNGYTDGSIYYYEAY